MPSSTLFTDAMDRMADVVHLAHGCDIRPSLTTMEPRSDGGPPVIEYWVRPRGWPPTYFSRCPHAWALALVPPAQ